MFRREDVPLVVMTLVSLAILLVFVATSFAMVPFPVENLIVAAAPGHAAIATLQSSSVLAVTGMRAL